MNLGITPNFNAQIQPTNKCPKQNIAFGMQFTEVARAGLNEAKQYNLDAAAKKLFNKLEHMHNTFTIEKFSVHDDPISDFKRYGNFIFKIVDRNKLPILNQENLTLAQLHKALKHICKDNFPKNIEQLTEKLKHKPTRREIAFNKEIDALYD